MTERADRVEARLQDAGADLLLVTNLINLRYLTGFTGSNGMAVVGPGVRRFVTDFRYVTQAEREVPAFDRERGPQDFLEALADGWPEGQLRVGFEDQHLSVRQHERLRSVLPERLTLVPAGGLVEAERARKEPDELEFIRAAAELADAALQAVLERGVVGRTEVEVAFDLEVEIRRAGAEALSFPSIVASAEHGASPHAQPRDVAIAPDTLLTIDWGAKLDGYHSDCTRTFATGELPDDLAELYATVLEAQEAALAGVRPGRLGREVDAIARDIIDAAGHAEHFGHGLGHGVGLEVHEGPRLARTGEAPLEVGNVVTVEPGIYVPGRSGARIEDLATVTADGADVFSTLPKTLTIVG